ncbi:hypothetical protein GCM10018781_52030 [Kitasatospora indigofera]|uniref:Uncharacterized protein n=1 Tax=Kitasatospora indigofera TaxID=67307 RepID=A0A919G4A6_9ACTN|nr:hypothetical protein [Kitasatospora indigofera]GHH77807.1 hypothetical protein GCM10018781_52030 [Kitasatospora indigofera]
MTSLMPGRTHVLEADTADQFRTAVAAAPDEHCLAGVLDACLRPLVYSRHHWLVYKGEYRVRADLRSAFESCRQRDPREWDDEEADLMLSLFALDTASTGLDDLVDRVDSAAVREVLHARHALYTGVVAPAERAPDGLLALARRVEDLRPVVQRTHELFSVIDGRAWFRTEGVLPQADIDTERLTPAVHEVLVEVFGQPAGPAASDRLRAATRTAVATDGDSASVLRAVMRAALADPVLRADHVTLTCPMGDMLDRPHEMTTSDAFFTETQLRDGIELGDYAEQLGHESTDQLHRTIRARMLKLKRGAIRSLYGPGCLQGQFVEKHGGHMLFRNEDAHYRGHKSIGCSSGGRASFALRHATGGAEQVMTPMIGDFRVVRMSHDEDQTFTAAELPQVIRYGEWLRVVVEETYRLGAVLRTDAPSPTA